MSWLLGIENFLQNYFSWTVITPSIVVVLTKKGEFVESKETAMSSLVCPTCHGKLKSKESGEFICAEKHEFPQLKVGIVDLRDPRPEEVTF